MTVGSVTWRFKPLRTTQTVYSAYVLEELRHFDVAERIVALWQEVGDFRQWDQPIS
jgi:hypothetical protein